MTEERREKMPENTHKTVSPDTSKFKNKMPVVFTNRKLKNLSWEKQVGLYLKYKVGGYTWLGFLFLLLFLFSFQTSLTIISHKNSRCHGIGCAVERKERNNNKNENKAIVKVFS